MDEKKQFYSLLKPIQRELFWEQLLKEVQLLLMIAGGLFLIMRLIASVWIIPFFFTFFFIGCILLIGFICFRLWYSRPDVSAAAHVFNGFVEEDDVVTAFSFLNRNGAMERLQLLKTVRLMKKQMPLVLQRKKIYFYPKWIVLFFLFLFSSTLLHQFSFEKWDLAKKRETEIELLSDAKKELKKEMKKVKEPSVKEELAKTVHELNQAKTPREALKTMEKQVKQLELKQIKEQENKKKWNSFQPVLNDKEFQNLSESLKSQNISEIENALREANKNWNQFSDHQRNSWKNLTNQNRSLTEKELEQLAKELKAAAQADRQVQELAQAETSLKNSAQNLQEQMAANGLESSSLALSNANGSQEGGQASSGQSNNPSNSSGNPSTTPNTSNNGGNTSENPNSSNNQNGQGAGNGSSNSNGTGPGNSGNGSGTGSGSGSGGSGNGSGSGNGNGSGAGLGSGSRELLTIPEYAKGENRTEQDTGELGAGTQGQQMDGDGLVLKGSIRPYQEVYGEYEKAYRESTERYKLPTDLEDMVKNYFSNIDPDKE
ncbi:hypothetical protein [Bacillus sp. 03113]|uniref:coiled-coil domain-containing protein n=1 Tax=Bacillus sp. 03113 TaxID=2578211 RepID=UPI0015E8ADD7|nr:hypothetical protein [Bacillus sp. 03113]